MVGQAQSGRVALQRPSASDRRLRGLLSLLDTRNLYSDLNSDQAVSRRGAIEPRLRAIDTVTGYALTTHQNPHARGVRSAGPSQSSHISILRVPMRIASALRSDKPVHR